MAIVHNYDNRTGITYVYESHTYWDKEAKKYKAKRKLLGKLNENGEMVPTGQRGRPKKEPLPDVPDTQEGEAFQKALEDSRKELRELQTRYDEDVTRLYKEIEELQKELAELNRQKQSVLGLLEKAVDKLKQQ